MRTSFLSIYFTSSFPPFYKETLRGMGKEGICVLPPPLFVIETPFFLSFSSPAQRPQELNVKGNESLSFSPPPPRAFFSLPSPILSVPSRKRWKNLFPSPLPPFSTLFLLPSPFLSRPELKEKRREQIFLSSLPLDPLPLSLLPPGVSWKVH